MIVAAAAAFTDKHNIIIYSDAQHTTAMNYFIVSRARAFRVSRVILLTRASRVYGVR